MNGQIIAIRKPEMKSYPNTIRLFKQMKKLGYFNHANLQQPFPISRPQLNKGG